MKRNVNKKIMAVMLTLIMICAMGILSIPASAAETTVTTEADLAAALQTDGTVKLGANIVVNTMIVIPEGVTVTLDLNGKNITVADSTGNHIYALNNNGDLTLKDSAEGGFIRARGIYNGYNGTDNTQTVVGAKMTVESGTYYAQDSNGGSAIVNCAELIIKDGIFDCSGSGAAVNNRTKGVMLIENGLFRSNTYYAIQNNGGVMTIEYASVERGFGAIGIWGGTGIIKDGNYKPTGAAGKTCHVVYVDSGNVEILGGTYQMNYPENAVPDSGSAVASYNKADVKISGGSFTGHFDTESPVELSTGATITGGTYLKPNGETSTHPYITSFVAGGFELTTDGSVAEKPADTINTYEALVEKLSSGNNNILLGGSIVVPDKATLTIKDMILDLGGHTLTLNGESGRLENATLRNGTVEITTYEGDTVADGLFDVYDSVTIEDVTFHSDECKIYAILDIKEGDVAMDNCIVDIENNSPAGGLIYFNGGNKLTMNECTVTGTNVGDFITNGIAELNDCDINLKGTKDGGLDNAINGTALTLNNTKLTVDGATGRAITTDGDNIVIKGESVLKLSNNQEADIRFKASAQISIEPTVTVNVCGILVDTGVTNATINNTNVTTGNNTLRVANGAVTIENTTQKPVTYFANFMVDGNLYDYVIFAEGDTTLTPPAVPAKHGYTGAWESYTLGTEDITIDAIYTPNTYTVAFNANGGTGTMASQTMTYDTAAALTANAFTRENYVFKGWNTRADGTGTAYTDGASVKNLTATNRGTVTLYAMWTYTPNTYTVAFNANGGTGTMASQTMTYGTEAALTANAFTRENYVFNGWNTRADGTGTAYTDGASVKNLTATNQGTVTLYAMWSEIADSGADIVPGYTSSITRYSVCFKAENRIWIIRYREGADELTVIPKVPEKEGYIGAWEEYELNDKNIIVRAVYTQK